MLLYLSVELYLVEGCYRLAYNCYQPFDVLKADLVRGLVRVGLDTGGLELAP